MTLKLKFTFVSPVQRAHQSRALVEIREGRESDNGPQNITHSFSLAPVKILSQINLFYLFLFICELVIYQNREHQGGGE